MGPNEIEALIDKKLAEKFKPVEEKLDGILTLLAKFEGAGTIMKFIFLGIAPVIAAFVWVKDHVKF